MDISNNVRVGEAAARKAPYGSEPLVEVRANNGALDFCFAIPQGEQGPQGIPGNSVDIFAHNSDSGAHSAEMSKKAPLESPDFTGEPTVNSAQIATTAYVQANLGGKVSRAEDTMTGGLNIPFSELVPFTLIKQNAAGGGGGRMHLQKGNDNTAVSGDNLVVEMYQDVLRVYDSGPGNKGVHINLEELTGGYSSNKLWHSGNLNPSPFFVIGAFGGSSEGSGALRIVGGLTGIKTGSMWRIDFTGKITENSLSGASAFGISVVSVAELLGFSPDTAVSSSTARKYYGVLTAFKPDGTYLAGSGSGMALIRNSASPLYFAPGVISLAGGGVTGVAFTHEVCAAGVQWTGSFYLPETAAAAAALSMWDTGKDIYEYMPDGEGAHLLEM